MYRFHVLILVLANFHVTPVQVSLVPTHRYTDPPLKPQTEEWRVLSWPHPDWMLYIYCGSTPTGPYAGQVQFAKQLHALVRRL